MLGLCPKRRYVAHDLVEVQWQAAAQGLFRVTANFGEGARFFAAGARTAWRGATFHHAP
jgi:hypothetical protein